MKKYIIATLGSHSALQILKGAADEGFRTLVITPEKRSVFYRRFPFINEIISIKSYAEFSHLDKELKKRNTIIIPHGSFVAYLGMEQNKKMTLPYYGNKQVLDWEADRLRQHRWMKASKLLIPELFPDENITEYPAIVKSYGAAGGKGYFYAKNRADFRKKIHRLGQEKFIIQKYIIGVPLYIHYFYSPVENRLEILSIDRRYETNVDALGRIPLINQKEFTIEPSFVVVGNSPLTLRESLLPEAYAMGERVVNASKQLIGKKGLYGPFCLETIITPDQKFYVMEISCRIVAGTNLFIGGSPYSALLFDEPMSTGRRIAREIKMAIKLNKLPLIFD